MKEQDVIIVTKINKELQKVEPSKRMLAEDKILTFAQGLASANYMQQEQPKQDG